MADDIQQIAAQILSHVVDIKRDVADIKATLAQHAELLRIGNVNHELTHDNMARHAVLLRIISQDIRQMRGDEVPTAP